MKFLVNSTLMILMLGFLISCKNDLDSFADGNHRNKNNKDVPTMRSMKLSFGGDYISESEESLMRAEDGNTFIGINVFRTALNSSNENEEKYAYGVFTNKDDISVDLMTGFSYRFEASILIEKEDKLFKNNNAYRNPFQISDGDHNLIKPAGNGDFKETNFNKFIYSYLSTAQNGALLENSKRDYLCQLSLGTAYADNGGDDSPRYKYSFNPRVKRFYGTASIELNPWVAQQNEEIRFGMKYMCFGLRLELVSIPSGTIKVEDITPKDDVFRVQNDANMVFGKNFALSEDNKEFNGSFSINNLAGAYADMDNYSERLTLQFTWNKGVGVDPESFTKVIEIHPKKRKILRININGTPTENTKGNIILEMEDSTLTDEEAENILYDSDSK